MTTVPVEGLAPLAAMQLPQAPSIEPSGVAGAASALGAPQGAQGFAELVATGLRQTDQQLIGVQADLQRLAAGEAVPLHQLMIRLEESRIGLQLLLQVRNRLLESYQDLSRMQV